MISETEDPSSIRRAVLLARICALLAGIALFGASVGLLLGARPIGTIAFAGVAAAACLAVAGWVRDQRAWREADWVG